MTDDLIAERDAAFERARALEAELRHLRLTQVDHVIGLHAQVQTALASAATLRHRLSESKAEASRLRGLVRDGRTRIKALETENRRLTDQLSAIRSSRAWRIVRRLTGRSA
jgi:septal ring factor EnvC (AmiA/AmiB activator)